MLYLSPFFSLRACLETSTGCCCTYKLRFARAMCVMWERRSFRPML